MTAPQVFTPDFIAQIRRKYDRLPEYQRPLVAKIATDARRAEDRERIELWLARVREDDVRKLVALLRDRGHFLHTYHELAFVQRVLARGWTAEYERRYDVGGRQLTPDWTITLGGVEVICDVFTGGLIEHHGRSEEAIRELIGRLSALEFPHLVRLNVPNGFDLSARDQKQMCVAFATWLGGGVATGSVWHDNNCTITIVGPSHGKVEVIATDGMHTVPTATSITSNFREKAKKYGVLELPLLVAAVRHPDAEASEEMFSDSVLGEEVFRSIQLPDGSFVEGIDHEGGGAFDGRPELSAAYWLDPYAVGRNDQLLITNPTATRPLPERLIETLRLPPE